MTAALRVAQWATGTIGARSLRAVIEHPGLELAGVYVHSAAKEGLDAGELCGTDPTGVTATADIERVLELGADCVLYMPLECDADEVCRLLESGANVVTTRGEFHHPGSMDADLRKRVETACERGGTSIHSTGSSPGFITEAVPLVLTSIARRVDSLTIEEYADLSQRTSPELLFGVMGYGLAPAAFAEERLSQARTSFGPSLRLIAEELGIPLDSLEATGELATARGQVRIAAGELAPGTVAAQRLTVTGLRAGRPLLRFRATWYCTTDLDPAWDLHDTGWHISIEGDAPLDVGLRLPVPLDRMAEISPSYTANRAVNAVPLVCAATPGIRTTIDLPQVVAKLA
ncbi:NAD(P)H-dependent amine dehydrogenase family protein [Streptomyces cylindrosporus]|uniref:Dihydrodipicolinate reductase n=1 Tax=Streptomyces cylindrosporus TaxID=2927583 RepID=A0ABS9YAX8_9ACTN|nr:dihydrodipicolinate reductase [Streptomyces cylindrosporus]MCI3274357.1 dihydrodipicolinate reductase [Streptomyces cylindrosporus]